MTIEERAKKAIREHYNCEYPCDDYKDCVFGSGSNTSYDCGECGADDFNDGYRKGVTEQRKIDIDKACDLVYDQIVALIGYTEEAKNIAYKYFRKAMEEGQ